MSILTVFYIKLILCVLLTVVAAVLLRYRTCFADWQRQDRTDSRVFVLGFILLRFLPWVGIFLVFNEAPRGDVPFFFYKAEAAKQGGMVYRDFWSYHAPLFSYIISLPLWLWHNSRAIVLLMVVMEALILWATYRVYKSLTPDALLLTLLYWLLPATFIYILIDGQEEVWFWGIGILMLSYLYRISKDPETRLGALFAAALLTIKVTFIFLLPPLLVLVRKPLKMLLVMAAIGLPALLLLYVTIGDLFLMPIRHTEQLMSPNLFSVGRPFLELVVQIDEAKLPFINWIGLLFTVTVPSYMAFRLRDKALTKMLPLVFMIAFACMMLFQASAPGAYAICFLIVVVFELLDFKKPSSILAIALLSLLTVIQPFVYVYNEMIAYTSFGLIGADTTNLLDYLLQLANVGCLVWVVLMAYQKALLQPARAL